MCICFVFWFKILICRLYDNTVIAAVLQYKYLINFLNFLSY
jgi:hypothetical protein